MSFTNNAKVSDSGYTDTSGHSQSQRSSGSSFPKNSKRSESTGYCGGYPSTISSSNEALPRLIRRKKNEEHEKKKSKTTVESSLETAQNCGDQQLKIEPSTEHLASCTNEQTLNQQETKTVELVDVTDPEEHSSHSKSSVLDEELGMNNNSQDNEFFTIISLHDGLVLHSTVSLQTALGYPKDSWKGKSFIDYVDPKDKTVFAEKLVNSIILPFDKREEDLSAQTTSIFCSLRKYTASNTSENTSNYELKPKQKRRKLNEDVKRSEYIQFHLVLSFKYLFDRENKGKSGMMLMTIAAKPISSAYKVPEETIISSVFTTRHTATCHFSHVDDNIVQYVGFLPQDLIGRSLFDFYHPEDLFIIKDIYEIVIKLQGSSFRSEPYRFLVQNGGYLLMETEWSSFINPWTEKLEFVVGHHKVLRGPMNPNIFHPPDNCQQISLARMGDEILKQSQIIQNEICNLLKQKIETPVGIRYDNSSDLIELVDNLKNETKGLNVSSNIPANAMEDRSFSENKNVILREVSPQHEYCDSKYSSEIPPSYNQLNYNEKIERFFDSKPSAGTAYDCDEENIISDVLNSDEINKKNSSHTTLMVTEQNCDSGSRENLSSGSNNRTSLASRDSMNGNLDSLALDNLKLPTLTEILLTKHNLEMEKLMILKHKAKSMSIKINKLNEKARLKNTIKNSDLSEKKKGITCGLKRSSSHSQDLASKASKQDNGTRKLNTDNMKFTTFYKPNPAVGNINNSPQITVPFSHHIPIASTSTQNVQPQTEPNMVPIYYYLSIPRIPQNFMLVSPYQMMNQLSSHQSAHKNSFVPYVTPSTRVLHSQMMYAPPITSEISTVQKENPNKFQRVLSEKTCQIKRAASQATSIKAEPGSIMAMSESSKKLLSPGGQFSSYVNTDEVHSNIVDHQISMNTQSEQSESSIQDSSDSSFYGSFLHTSSDSNSNNTSSNKNSKVNVSRCREDVTIERRRFSMINQLKANYELQKPALHAPFDVEKSICQKIMTGNGKAEQEFRKMNSPWPQEIKMTPDLIFRYQMKSRPLNDVLEADLKALKQLRQPQLVNDQLEQLYRDLKLEGFSAMLNLGDTSMITDQNIVDDINEDKLSSQESTLCK